MTGVPDNGNEWRKFRVVPRLHLLHSLVLLFFGVEREGLVDYQGKAGIISIVRWNHIQRRIPANPALNFLFVAV